MQGIEAPGSHTWPSCGGTSGVSPGAGFAGWDAGEQNSWEPHPALVQRDEWGELQQGTAVLCCMRGCTKSG